MVHRIHDNLLTPSFVSDSKVKNHRRVKGHYGTGVSYFMWNNKSVAVHPWLLIVEGNLGLFFSTIQFFKILFRLETFSINY